MSDNIASLTCQAPSWPDSAEPTSSQSLSAQPRLLRSIVSIAPELNPIDCGKQTRYVPELSKLAAAALAKKLTAITQQAGPTHIPKIEAFFIDIPRDLHTLIKSELFNCLNQEAMPDCKWLKEELAVEKVANGHPWREAAQQLGVRDFPNHQALEKAYNECSPEERAIVDRLLYTIVDGVAGKRVDNGEPANAISIEYDIPLESAAMERLRDIMFDGLNGNKKDNGPAIKRARRGENCVQILEDAGLTTFAGGEWSDLQKAAVAGKAGKLARKGINCYKIASQSGIDVRHNYMDELQMEAVSAKSTAVARVKAQIPYRTVARKHGIDVDTDAFERLFEHDVKAQEVEIDEVSRNEAARCEVAKALKMDPGNLTLEQLEMMAVEGPAKALMLEKQMPPMYAATRYGVRHDSAAFEILEGSLVEEQLRDSIEFGYGVGDLAVEWGINIHSTAMGKMLDIYNEYFPANNFDSEQQSDS